MTQRPSAPPPSTLRSVGFAYLIAPPRNVTRAEASAAHATLCDQLDRDDLTFAYRTTPGATPADPEGFQVLLQQGSRQSGFQVMVETTGPNGPIRMFLAYSWPESIEVAKTIFDTTTETLLETLFSAQPSQRLLAETRIRTDAPSPEANGSGFLQGELLQSDAKAFGFLDRTIASFSADFTLAPSAPGAPVHQVKLEPLASDPERLYVEVVSKWAAAAEDANGKRSATPVESPPSRYLSESWRFLSEEVAQPAAATGKGPSRMKKQVEPSAN